MLKSAQMKWVIYLIRSRNTAEPIQMALRSQPGLCPSELRSYPIPPLRSLLWVPGPAEVCVVTLRASHALSQIRCSWAQQENQLTSINVVKQSAHMHSGCGHCAEGMRTEEFTLHRAITWTIRLSLCHVSQAWSGSSLPSLSVDTLAARPL